MKLQASERRVSRRLQIKTALRLRVWKSGSTERRAESLDLSEKGTFFVTDVPIPIGSAVEILLKMPEEVTGKPTTEWRCSGHVVRLQPVDTPRGKLGVGVEFDYYEILRSKAAARLEIG
jgi:Tfp pilus assembly protein PilZ